MLSCIDRTYHDVTRDGLSAKAWGTSVRHRLEPFRVRNLKFIWEKGRHKIGVHDEEQP